MFKKKGPSGFKPKIPSARPRPTARAAAPAPAATVQAPIAASDNQIEESEHHETAAVEQVSGTPEDVETSSSRVPEPISQPIPTPPVSTTSTIDPNKAKNQESTQPSQDGTLEEEARNVSQPTEVVSPTPRRRRMSSRLPPTPSATPVVAEEPADASAPVETATETVEESVEQPARVKKPAKRTKKAAVTSDVVEVQADEGESTNPKKRQLRATQDGDAAPKPKKTRKTPTSEPKAPRTRRARSLTPEDAETQTVDLQKLKMADLTKDLHIGKKFSRHDELRERERQKKLKAKLAKAGGQDDDGSTSTPAEEGIETPGESAESSRPKSSSETPAPSAPPSQQQQQAPAGPQFRIVDGQIVVDQESLAVDRHARAAAARAGDYMETIEENDFTRLITSNSFMNTSKLKGPNIWTDEETLLFYRGIAMFGTDFEIISKMIPGKTRRHVKLKFNREERHCPRRINAALIGEKTVAMDIDEYKAATGVEFETVEAINAAQQKIEDDYEAERKRIADEQAEAMRKKREELFADEDVGGVVPKKKKKGKKKKVEYGLNGEPIEMD